MINNKILRMGFAVGAGIAVSAALIHLKVAQPIVYAVSAVVTFAIVVSRNKK